MPKPPIPQVPQPDLQLEIAHLLLIDIVGYSKLLVNEQIEALQELARIVRSTECFRNAEEKGKLIRVPTGDGMALLFFRSPEEPVRCALQISQAGQGSGEFATLLYQLLDAALDESLAAVQQALPRIPPTSGTRQ